MEIKELQKQLDTIEGNIKTFVEKHAEEVKTNGTASTETKTALDKLGTQQTETQARLLAIEQRITAPNGTGTDGDKSFGNSLIESDGYKSVAKGGSRSGPIDIPSLHKTAIVNATGQNQPLVPAMRLPGVQGPGLRRLTIRDLIPAHPTSTNLIEYCKELLFTNAAAMQTGGSPNSGENIAKAESALTFELATSPVRTLAHWIPASRQIVEDAPALRSYVDSRMTYGLKLAEENQFLNGSGSGQNLSGLITEADNYDTAAFPNVSGDQFMDTLRNAMTQVQLSYFEPDGIVLHPKDWAKIELTKETGSGISSGQYIFANPQSTASHTLWGLPVVTTQSMAESQFLVGAFGIGAAIWDRTSMTVELSREHDDFFIKNMLAILVEERIGFTVFRPSAFVYGGFPYGS